MAEGFDCCFVGLRKEEGCSRKYRIMHNISISQIHEVYPLQNLSWLDIWAYIISNKLPYLTHYDKYGAIIGYDKVRFGTFFDDGLDFIGASNFDNVLMWQNRNDNK